MVDNVVDGAYKLQERYNWNQLDFVFPSQQMKDIAIASGNYIPQNALPVGIEHWANKLFVTIPRWKDGKEKKSIITNIIDKSKISFQSRIRFLKYVFTKKPKTKSILSDITQ